MLSEPPLAGRRRALLLLVGALLGLWTLWGTWLLPKLPPLAEPLHTIQSVGVRLLLWVVPSAIYLRSQYGARVLEGLRLGFPPTSRHLLDAMAISALASFAVSLDVARKLGIGAREVWTRLLADLTFEFPTAPLFEELIFRGVILSELLILVGAVAPDTRDVGQRLRAWLANLAASLVFVGLHWPWWIYTRGFCRDFWVDSAGVGLISLVLGMVFVRGRSLWPCVLLHWLNNELSHLAS